MSHQSMTGYVCAAMAVLAAAAPARAQGVEFGVKGGLVRATLATSGEGAFDTGAESGGSLGVSVGVPLGANWRLQPEVLVGTLRFAVEGTPASVSISGRIVEGPVLVHARFGEASRVRPLLFAGPVLSVISKVTQSTDGFEEDVSDQVANVDAGITAGGGFEVAAGRGAMTVDVRINVGFRNLNEADIPRFKSRAWQFLLGYRF